MTLHFGLVLVLSGAIVFHAIWEALWEKIWPERSDYIVALNVPVSAIAYLLCLIGINALYGG